MYYVAGHCCDCLPLISSTEEVRSPQLLLSASEGLFFFPFPSRNCPKLVNCCAGNMKGDSLTFFFHVNQLESSCKERLGAGVVSS